MEVRDFPVEELVAPGKVEFNPNRVSRVLPPVAGRVKRVLVKLGDSVTEGQTVVVIESAEAGLALVGLTEARAEERPAAVTLARAERDLARLRELNANKAAPLKDVVNAEAEVELAKSALGLGQAGTEEALHRLEPLGLDPARHTHEIEVKAPIGGEVLELAVTPEELGAGSGELCA